MVLTEEEEQIRKELAGEGYWGIKEIAQEHKWQRCNVCKVRFPKNADGEVTAHTVAEHKRLCRAADDKLFNYEHEGLFKLYPELRTRVRVLKPCLGEPRPERSVYERQQQDRSHRVIFYKAESLY